MPDWGKCCGWDYLHCTEVRIHNFSQACRSRLVTHPLRLGLHSVGQLWHLPSGGVQPHVRHRAMPAAVRRHPPSQLVRTETPSLIIYHPSFALCRRRLRADVPVQGTNSIRRFQPHLVEQHHFLQRLARYVLPPRGEGGIRLTYLGARNGRQIPGTRVECSTPSLTRSLRSLFLRCVSAVYCDCRLC